MLVLKNKVHCSRDWALILQTWWHLSTSCISASECSSLGGLSSKISACLSLSTEVKAFSASWREIKMIDVVTGTQILPIYLSIYMFRQHTLEPTYKYRHPNLLLNFLYYIYIYFTVNYSSSILRSYSNFLTFILIQRLIVVLGQFYSFTSVMMIESWKNCFIVTEILPVWYSYVIYRCCVEKKKSALSLFSQEVK